MLFNSFAFLVFLPTVLVGYYLLRRRHGLQNAFLVIASCYFYASWDWRFLFPLLFSTTIDYFCALRMEASHERGEPQSARLRYMRLSLVTNLGLLGFFKYFNFFVDSLHDLFIVLGVDLPRPGLRVILPIGISFYTFQALSYTIDVYRGKLHATRSFWDFFLALLFFPHLVAGPIQRASNLLAQVVNPRRTTRAQVADGLHLILWGFFKKVFVADSLAPIANGFFANPTPSGGETVAAVLAFAFQIYGDFSGYTDIARGVAKLMGFEFMLNFDLPYFATNPSDFWRRWHISLSTWLRDYLYVSLGGNRNGPLQTYRNLMLTMVLGGLWHGAAWNFVVWGFYHGGLLCAHRLAEPVLSRVGAAATGPWRLPWRTARTAAMFALTCYGWLLFRARSLEQIATMTASLVHPFAGLPTAALHQIAVFAAPLFVVELLQFVTGRDLLREPWLPAPARAVVYAMMFYCVAFLGATPQAFVYFQF